MTTGRSALIIGLAGLLSGCIALPCDKSLSGCPAPSSGFAAAMGLPPKAQDELWRTLTIEQRLDVYHDVYIRSGHPRIMRADLFEGTGEPGFDAAMARMTDAGSFNEYFWIASRLGQGEVDICSPPFFEQLQDKVKRYGRGDPAHPVPIRFDRCEVVL
ncbi:MAG: hypothetical protein EON91_10775 [Brevundimonas sp.]|uniref:hypothetical protein n=1 Tax=Brevundimonas sp. TaxID=1871086 RepID=UPI001213A7E8|nr:hypothetical protein [Brevundimonas sp.]RZJ17037.1 MAG: hypothetical protein EON91_10775 [Brevundimonas sp.]